MTSISFRILISLALFAGAISALRGETISFPKENPAFTFELPKDLKAKFDPPERLVFNGGSFFLFETKQSDTAHEKKSLDALSSVPCERVQAQRVYKEPATESKGPSGLIVLESGCVGAYNEGPQVHFQSKVISFDGKRFFVFGFYDEGVSELVEAMVRSIKPAAPTPASTASPQR